MTGDVESAIELAVARLDDLRIRDEWDNPGRWGRYSALFSMEHGVRSRVRGPTVWQGDHELVKDRDGQLVPATRAPGINWYEIYDDEKGARLVAAAMGGDYLAHNVLSSVAARFVAAGCPMPPHLWGYIVSALEDQALAERAGKRGRDPYANHARDFIIANAIYDVVTQDGFLPTRNRASNHESACSIVAQALARRGIHMGEKAIEKIWGRWSAYMRDEGD